jgi:hypothetical protein
MIVSTLEQVQKCLPSINFKVDIDRLTDFLDRGEQWLTDSIIGDAIRTTLNADVPQNSLDPHADLRKICSRVICEYAYLTVAAEMDLQLSEAGFVVQDNASFAPASQQRTERLISSLNMRMNIDCDELVKYLMAKSTGDNAPYAGWRQTPQFEYLTRSFLSTRMQLSRHLTYGNNIGNWQDFFNGIVMMANGINEFAADYVSMEEIIHLRDLYRRNAANEVQQAAIGMLQDVAADCFVKDGAGARQAAIRARRIMQGSPADFPAFEARDCMPLPDVSFNEGHIVDTM